MSNNYANCDIQNGICTITLNDGNRNVISPIMIEAIHDTLDRAEKEKAVVILTGIGDVFSAGFDLNIMKKGNIETISMLSGGFKLAERIFSFPQPVVVACNGHAIAMGAFLLLSGDYRVGAEGNYKIATNEVEIGLTMPAAGIELCRHRLLPTHFSRAVLLAETFSPLTAVEAGFLDHLVSSEMLHKTALTIAERFTKLDKRAHYQTKLRARQTALLNIKRFIITDRAGFLIEGARRYFK